MQRVNQVLFCNYTVRVRVPQTGFDSYGYVSRYDHEFFVSLTLIKFTYQPVKAVLIKRAVTVNIRTWITILLGVVEYEDSDREVRFWFERVAGESCGYVALAEPM